jgi:hypothetical protein
MSVEQLQSPAPKRPYEVFGFTEPESLSWRVKQERFQEILEDDLTVIHTIQPSSNDYGEFLFVTTSRPGDKERIAMTFYGLGYHEYPERWVTEEWFWYQSSLTPEQRRSILEKEAARDLIQEYSESILPSIGKNTQSNFGRMFEMLADLNDEDGALAEIEDLDSLDGWLFEVDQLFPPEEIDDPPLGENLLDQASREKLPPLYSGEEKGLQA